MILVFGSTGTVGREVVARLIAAGERVRAFTRDPQGAGFGTSVEVVRGDLDDPDTLPAALAGIDRIFLLSTGPGALTQDTNVTRALRDAKPAHVVKLSSVAARPPIDNSYGQAHAIGERLVQDAAASWTILRPAAFMSNVLQWTWSIRSQGKVYAPFGAIPRALIHPCDVASVAVEALTCAGHEGRTYTLTGPQALTTPEQVEQVSAVLGRPLEYIEVAPAVARQAMVAAGMDAALVDGMLASLSDPDHERGGTPLRTVEDVTGRPPRALRSWLDAHIDALR